MGKEYFKKGNELYLDKKYLEALSYYIMAAEKDDMKEISLYNAATCYLSLKKYDKAIEYYKRVLEMNKYNKKAHYNLGISYKSNNNSKAAFRHFNIALALDNEDQECNKAVKAMEKVIFKCR